MVNYQNGKIYMLIPVNNEDDEQLVYIGSTTKKYLSTRLSQHISSYKLYKQGKTNFCTSFILFDKYNIENIHIILLEMYSCNNKDELRAKEAEYIKKTVNCVNKNKPGRTVKIYYQDNKEDLIVKFKKYYQDNKQTLNEKNIKYYQDNKQILTQKYICNLCGGKYSKQNISIHNKTIKHTLNNIDTNNNNLNFLDVCNNDLNDLIIIENFDGNIKQEIEELEKENEQLKTSYNILNEMYIGLLKKYDIEEYNEINKYLNESNNDVINVCEAPISNDEDLSKKLDELKIDNHVLDCCFNDLSKKVFKLMRSNEKDKLDEILNEDDDNMILKN